MAQFHTFLDYDLIQLPGLVVPQSVFRAPQTDQPRPPIQFVEYGRPGLLLRHALSNNFDGMADGAVYPVLSPSEKITVRINWPGYANWSNQLRILSRTGEGITKQKLAYEIANHVRLFFNDMTGVAPGDPTAVAWSVSNVRFEDIVLLELRHVSTGSWQPVLCRIVRA